MCKQSPPRGVRRAWPQSKYSSPPAQASGFCRDRLPSPADYYKEALRPLGKPNGAGWAWAICQFHADKKPSLRVNTVTGAYRCFACGVHGGDVLAYHMALHSLDFTAAAKALGAWDVAPSWGAYR